ncbi:restriction endonuclease subunit S [Streptomyces cinerochromogenes]|uniref:restriction endonuclease subunit S n=1 Tax=Streptomyces cinerochromogenes TaxID=66422 RepID=UPI0033A1F017
MSEGGIPSELPKGWARIRLGDILARIEAGKSYKCEPRPASAEEWGVIKVSAMTWGDFDEDENKAVPAGFPFNPDYEIRSGDILLSRANTAAYVGASVLVRKCRPRLLLSDKSLRLVPVEGVDRDWLAYLISSPVIRSQISERATGTKDSMRNISQGALAELECLLPPLEEQRRIVAALEEQMSRLDAAEDNAAEARRKLLAYKASRELEIVPSPEAGTAEQTLPEGWRMVCLSDISYSSGYGTSTKCSYDGSGSPVLRIPNIQGGSIDTTDLKYALDAELDLNTYKVRAGDLLVVRTNGSRDLIGRVAVSHEDSDYAFASYLIRFRLKTEDASPDWVAKVLSTRPWRRIIEAAAASTAGQYNLNLKNLGSLPIPLPSLQQQHSLTAALGEIDESVRRLANAVDDASLKGDVLRRSLLAEAFAGRLVPQDPTDEPADALLDRIRAEREAAGATKSLRRSPRRTPAQRKRTPDTAPVPDAPPPPPADTSALATATQPTLDLEIPS